MFFKILKYSELWPSLVVSVCTHTRQAEHQRCRRNGRVQKNHKVFRKKHNISWTPYIWQVLLTFMTSFACLVREGMIHSSSMPSRTGQPGLNQSWHAGIYSTKFHNWLNKLYISFEEQQTFVHFFVCITVYQFTHFIIK